MTVSGADPAFVATPSSPTVSTKGFNPGEVLTWEATTPAYIRWVSDRRYHKFSAAVRRWYRPVCAKCGEKQP